MTQTQQATTEPPSVPTGYALRYPESWWHLELDPSTRDATIRRRLLAGLDEETADRDLVDSMVRAARKAAREAHARGALQLAGMFELMDDGSPLIGTTMVLRIISPDEDPPDLSQLMVSYAIRNAGLPLGKNTSANQADLIELPLVGPAGRVTSVEDIDFYGKGWARMAIMHTVVPVPESGDFLVIASSTPNVGLTDEFFEVFDAISGTLKFEFNSQE